MAIAWDSTKNNISQVTLPNGDIVYIKDKEARDEIDKLSDKFSSYTEFLGVTTTILSDGAENATISIGGEDVTAKNGDIAIYGSKEFIFNGNAWAEFGDLDALADQLGDLAYNNTASASYTPEGDVNLTFTGTPNNISVSGTTTGSITGLSWTGKEKAVTVSGSTTGTVEIAENSLTGNYEPSGTIEYSITVDRTPVFNTSTSGTLPQFTASLLTASVSGENLVFTLAANGFNPGSFPEFSTSNVINTVTSNTATFTGNKVDITFSGSAATFGGSYTPEVSTISATFSGSTATFVGSYDPTTEISTLFTGTTSTITVEGSVSKPSV